MEQKKATKRPTLKELASEAGVSVASASYALNGTGSVGEKTREHILEVARRIGYRQNAAARAMKIGRSGTLGLVVPDLTNPFFPSLAQSVIQTARSHGYGVFVTDTEGDEALEGAALAMLADRGVDGVIWFPVRDHDSSGGALEGIPTIVIDRSLPGFDGVVANCSEGGRLAARHLLDAGHRRIGIISGPDDILSMRQRCEAARVLVEAEGELAFFTHNAFSIDLEPAVAAALDTSGLTAVFAGADVIAVGVLRHLAATGRRAPDDLSVVGFDDIPWSELTTPPLTTIDLPLQSMANEAVEALVRKIERGTGTRRTVTVDTGLVERATVRRI
ncbi:LacI family transcriptional regulator [Sphingomonas zeicaulis]|uniref:LacI family DNA-binding transcriptional regulator n=1 Tax=Sphingomonas zeicaulis TaxID=1632740 RepID=UPI003D1BAE62